MYDSRGYDASAADAPLWQQPDGQDEVVELDGDTARALMDSQDGSLQFVAQKFKKQWGIRHATFAANKTSAGDAYAVFVAKHHNLPGVFDQEVQPPTASTAKLETVGMQSTNAWKESMATMRNLGAVVNDAAPYLPAPLSDIHRPEYPLYDQPRAKFTLPRTFGGSSQRATARPRAASAAAASRTGAPGGRLTAAAPAQRSGGGGVSQQQHYLQDHQITLPDRSQRLAPKKKAHQPAMLPVDSWSADVAYGDPNDQQVEANWQQQQQVAAHSTTAAAAPPSRSRLGAMKAAAAATAAAVAMQPSSWQPGYQQVGGADATGAASMPLQQEGGAAGPPYPMPPLSQPAYGASAGHLHHHEGQPFYRVQKYYVHMKQQPAVYQQQQQQQQQGPALAVVTELARIMAEREASSQTQQQQQQQQQGVATIMQQHGYAAPAAAHMAVGSGYGSGGFATGGPPHFVGGAVNIGPWHGISDQTAALMRQTYDNRSRRLDPASLGAHRSASMLHSGAAHVAHSHTHHGASHLWGSGMYGSAGGQDRFLHAEWDEAHYPYDNRSRRLAARPLTAAVYV